MLKRILIVDDEPDTIKLLTLRLTKSGYHVIPCSTGRFAIASAKKNKPDLAILDIKLPDINGYDVLKEFRKNPSLAEMPVIFSTADASVAVKKTVEEYAANDFVIKPYDAKDLLKKINALLTAGRTTPNASLSLQA